VAARPYETLFITLQDQGGRVKELVEKFKKIIEGMGGTLSQVEEWGLRDLAYRIQKQRKGYYTLLRYQAETRTVEELERNMKLAEEVLRYLTVRLDEEGEAPQTKKDQEPSEGAGRKSQEEGVKPPES